MSSETPKSAESLVIQDVVKTISRQNSNSKLKETCAQNVSEISENENCDNNFKNSAVIISDTADFKSGAEENDITKRNVSDIEVEDEINNTSNNADNLKINKNTTDNVKNYENTDTIIITKQNITEPNAETTLIIAKSEGELQNNNIPAVSSPLPIVPTINTLRKNVLNLMVNYQELKNNNFKLDVSCQTDENECKNEREAQKTNTKYKENLINSSSTESITKSCHPLDDLSYTEEVEIRQKKRLNIRVALRNSFNKKTRSKKSKSESSVLEGIKCTKMFKDLANGLASLIQSQRALTMSIEQPPAPLLVEDPPTDNEGGEGDIKNPSSLNGSSGNFTSAGSSTSNSGVLQSNAGGPGARSAPSTPQGLLTTPPGAPTQTDAPPPSPSAIQRSPSHAVFSKVDKTNLKHLSTSTPVMTAQGQLTEPPSPKAVKDPKVHITSKARQKKFQRHFPNVEEEEKVLNHYSCALIGDILLQGHLYITKNYFAFYSNVFGYVTKLLIPILTVEDITKEKTARIIPNAVGVMTLDDKHIFGSLMSRDSTLAYMRTVWQKAKSEEVIPEPDIVEPEDPDISESSESGRESPIAEINVTGSPLSTPKFSLMRKISKEGARSLTEQGPLLERKGSKGFIHTLKDAIAEFRKLPRQNLILVATTLLLVLLFLSAAVLLYRINKIQNRFSLSLQEGGFANNNGGDIYGNLLKWQAQLHSKSADAVNNLLDSNLDQISKVRQSLEALSMLLIPIEDSTGNDGTIEEQTKPQLQEKR